MKIKFLLIILIFLFSINVISATEIESNTTNPTTLDQNNNPTNNDNQNNIKPQTTEQNNNPTNNISIKDEEITKNNLNENNPNNDYKANTTENSFSDTKNTIIKYTPYISIKSTKIKSRDTISIYLKDSNNIPIINKQITVTINSKTYTIFTDFTGTANLKLKLTPNTYNINIQFTGDDELNPNSLNKNIHVSKLSTKIITHTNFVIKKGYLYIYLLGNDEEGINGKLKIKLRKKRYIKTANKNGRIRIKINLKPGKYSIKINYKGNNYFKASSKKIKFHVTKYMTFHIENRKLVKNGYLRIYLKDKKKYKKKFSIKIGSQKYYKKTNSEGIIVLKVNLIPKKYNILVKHGKYSIRKKITCINDTIKNPLENNISLTNGVPDIDYMPANYVKGDNSATYTLKRKQYLEVIKRDSYCLYLNNKLSKYVFFKTTSHPHTYHIIKRGKWNIIEKEINKRIVAKNKYKYWPVKIKVSLKGKSRKYSEVRDIQNKWYTCGPTSASVCSQVLRNYIPEGYLSKRSHTTKSGTKIQNLEKVLNRHNFICTHFYRNSFNYALKELKKGGCALIFHSQHHYVSIIDISKNGKKVLVSNSYGTYNKIPSKWLSIYYMKHKFGVWDDSLIIRLNYHLSNSTRNSVNCFYNSMGKNWNRHNTREKI